MDEIVNSFRRLYKNGKFGDQQQRRNEVLQLQKSNPRYNYDNCAGIGNLMESALAESRIFTNYYQCAYTPNVYVPGFNNTSNIYQGILMLSEWMTEKPVDFSTSWYVTPCPKGTRLLVIACNGITKCYTKYGQFVYATWTLLPGGNPQDSWGKSSALDCYFIKGSRLMYVLDVLAWNNYIIADGEMEFRQFWLRSKFNEEPALMKITDRNRLCFNLLPMIPCNTQSLQQCMLTFPPLPEGQLDGLLFYHKEGRYVPGETPLVVWLYPYMVPEVLGSDIIIHSSFAAEKPENYVDQATYIKQFEEKAKRRQFRGSALPRIGRRWY